MKPSVKKGETRKPVTTEAAVADTVDKETFDIDRVFELLRPAVAPFPKAGLFQLRDEGFTTPWEQLVSCLLSIRTFDEAAVPASRDLLAAARTPKALAAFSIDEIDTLIGSVTYHRAKAESLRDLANIVETQYAGDLPCDFETLVALRGVGPKCANLVLGIACNQPRIGVDIHVHRVTNRWGFVSAPTPEKTLIQLEAKLPEKYAVEINERLVPFGKHICTGKLPKCSICPLLRMCRQVGVAEHR